MGDLADNPAPATGENGTPAPPPVIPVFIPTPPKIIPAAFTPEQILLGPTVEPRVHIRNYSDDDFEEFIREWAYSYGQLVAKRYVEIGRFGGAGDMGRDVVGYIDPPGSGGKLDIFQCKHYGHGLQPNEVWVELGKLCYYTHIGAFAVPEQYRFVAPDDVGNKLGQLIEKPEELRTELIAAWEESVSGSISKGRKIPLVGTLLHHVQTFDFKRVRCKQIHEILQELRQTSRYAPRFGGGLTQPCPDDLIPPNEIQAEEKRYVEQLLEAYTDHHKKPVTLDDLPKLQELLDFLKHFIRARERYYCAETLKQFARDNLPEGTTFKQVQDQVRDVVIETAEDDAHASGFIRVKEVTRLASLYKIVNHPLASYMKSQNLTGICHHLANIDELKWVKR